MRHSPRNLKFHELIGLRVKVVSHSDPSVVGVEGVVIDETKNTLVVEADGKRKRILKLYGIFEFVLPSGVKVRVDGTEILGRPEDRLKRVKEL